MFVQNAAGELMVGRCRGARRAAKTYAQGLWIGWYRGASCAAEIRLSKLQGPVSRCPEK